MSKSSPIAVGGENLIDHVTSEGCVSALPGGSPFNVALALGRQGANTHYLSPISQDSWGDELAQTARNAGVTLAHPRVDAPTTLARVTVTDGIPEYEFVRDGTAERQITTDSLARIMPQGLGALHTGSLAVSEGADGDAWIATLKTAHAAGTLVSFDPNVRLSVIKDHAAYRDRVFELISSVTLLKFSDEDLEGLFPQLGFDAALTQIRELTSAELLVMTKGPDGACAWGRDSFVDIPAPPVPDLVDTVGAGDTFMATLLAGLDRMNALAPTAVAQMTTSEIEKLLHAAGTASAINCTRAGCNPPTLAELKQALEAN